MNKLGVFLFFAKVILLFLLLLVLYHYLSPFLLVFLSKSSESALQIIYPAVFDAITLKNRMLEVLTHFQVIGIPGSQLAFDLDPLKYTYGFPLFVALSLATKGKLMDKLWQILLAFLVTLGFQVWGVCFDIIRHLLFEFEGAYRGYFAMNGLQQNLVSLGSQLGFLLFPSLIPIILWVHWEKSVINELLFVNRNHQ